MRLTGRQFNAYQEKGFLLLPDLFTEREVEIMKEQLPSLYALDAPGRVKERDGRRVRSVYGSHTHNEVFRCLTEHPRVALPAEQLLGSKVYTFQFKINAKAAFGGDVWEWHQDYIFWRNEDGMPDPRVLSVAIFLDEVNEFNGPLLLIPGSHKEGILAVPSSDMNGKAEDGYEKDPEWIALFGSSSLKYTMTPEAVARLARQNGIEAPKAPAGSALFFHSNIVHSSGTNMSPFDRNVAVITYNSVLNIPVPVGEPRPQFLSSADCRPIAALSDDALLRAGAAASGASL